MQVNGAASAVDHAAMPTLGAIPSYFARQRPTAVASSFEGRDTTWAELDARANRVANALRAMGLGAGDRVAFVGKGSDEFFELMFGAARAGLTLVPIIWRLAPPEVTAIVRDCEAKALFVAPDQFERLEAWKRDLPGVTFIALEDGADDLWRFADWRDAQSDSSPGVDVDPGGVALQLYTSGTTGLPKGVMLSHANLLRGRTEAAQTNMDWNDWLEGDVNLVALPLGHIGGVGWAVVGYFNGARSVIQREFIPGAILDAIEQGVTKLFLVPTALHLVLQNPRVREIDYSRLRYILYGASPIALHLLQQATEVFGCGFAQQYGATETCGTIVYLPPEDHDPAGNQRMRGAGLPMPGVELRIVDRDRKVLPPHEIGEIETRSVANMIGYWKQDAATAEALDADGWFRTGDAGYLDDDGYLYIADRFKDMICTGAENVYPNEVENAIFGHPAVLEVSVIGVPDEKWGETVKAVVVLKPGAEPDAANIIAWARERIAPFKVPKTVDFIDALPRNPSGKILRRVLREPYWAGRERQVN